MKERCLPAVLLFLVLLLILVFSGCTSRATQAPTKLVVESRYVKEGKLKLDGAANEAVWGKARPLSIATSVSPPAKAQGPAVLMKSFYTDTTINFLLTWADSTNDNISKVWEFDGSKWTQGPEQDKLSILWDRDDSVAYFNIKGCQAVCHSQDADKNLWYMATNGRREKTDFWFWMAGIGNLYDRADDRFLDDTVDPEDAKAATRRADRGDRGFDKNGYKGAVEKIAPVRPTKKYLLGYDFESDPYPLAQHMDDITSYKVFKAGEKIPFIYFYGPPTDSRGDVRAKGVWKNGRWTLEISRKLNTGHKDDMVFRPSSEAVYYMFGLAVFDHSEPPPVEHFVSGPVSLKLVPK